MPRIPAASLVRFAMLLGLLSLVPAPCTSAGGATPSASGAAPLRVRSGLEGVPGYVPPMDPESLSVVRGRRIARAVSMPFTDGRKSLEDLARTSVSALEAGNEAALRRLCITDKEFATILWPEFPQSRPVTGATAADAWYFIYRQQYGGIRRATDSYGRQPLTWVRVEHDPEPVRFHNFRLWRHVVVVVKDSEGVEQRLDFVRTIAERKGVFKLYALRD